MGKACGGGAECRSNMWRAGEVLVIKNCSDLGGSP